MEDDDEPIQKLKKRHVERNNIIDDDEDIDKKLKTYMSMPSQYPKVQVNQPKNKEDGDEDDDEGEPLKRSRLNSNNNGNNMNNKNKNNMRAGFLFPDWLANPKDNNGKSKGDPEYPFV